MTSASQSDGTTMFEMNSRGTKTGGRAQERRGEERSAKLIQVFGFQHLIRGERGRSPPLPEIMQSRFPHLGNSHGSAKHGVQWLSLAVGEPPP